MRQTYLSCLLVAALVPASVCGQPQGKTSLYDIEHKWDGRIEYDPVRLSKIPVAIRFGCHSDVPDAVLADLTDFAELRNLDILSDKITDAGLVALKKLPHLEGLYLNPETVTDQTVVNLKAFPNLRELEFMRSKITAKGLAGLKELRNLKKLHLVRINIDPAGLEHLKQMTHLEELTFGQLDDPSTEAVEQLKKALPKVKIRVR